MKSIGQIIHQKTFPLVVIDNDGKEVYRELGIGEWEKQEYDYTKIMDTSWWTWKYDSNGAITKWRNSYGYSNK